LGVFRIEKERGDDNEIGLKEKGTINNQNYSAFHIRDAPLLHSAFDFTYLNMQFQQL
tara:strand:- start:1 stop:171 length:171 start_codon:yes stop_codon:yes gene_type:complete